MKNPLLPILLIACILSACHPKLAQDGPYKGIINTVESHKYYSKTNTTVYSVIPYGQATLPGRWIAGRYAKGSMQQLFARSTDSLYIDIAFYSARKLPFYTRGLAGNALTQKYYEWETQYQREETHMQTELLEIDTINHFVMWRVFDNATTNSIQLFGTKDCKCNDVGYQLYTVFSKKRTPTDTMAAMAKRVYMGG